VFFTTTPFIIWSAIEPGFQYFTASMTKNAPGFAVLRDKAVSWLG
jgi:hypothetical protein